MTGAVEVQVEVRGVLRQSCMFDCVGLELHGFEM